jgi:hypothetical protein
MVLSVGIDIRLPCSSPGAVRGLQPLNTNPLNLNMNPLLLDQVAWSSSGELRGQYSDARALHASGAINNTGIPNNFTQALRRHYYGAVSYIDYQVGRVLTALSDNGQRDNTVVALWGDHGYQV